MVRGLCAVALVIMLGGCAEFVEEPKGLVVTRFAPTFGTPPGILYVNLTLTNVANITIHGGIIFVVVRSHHANESHRDGVSDDLPFDSVSIELSSQQRGAKPAVYYTGRARAWLQDRSLGSEEGFYGPVNIAPGGEENITFGFRAFEDYEGTEGYYTADIDVRPRANRGFAPDLVQTGCFNKDTPVYYGELEGRLECVYWDATGMRFPLPSRVTPSIRWS